MKKYLRRAFALLLSFMLETGRGYLDSMEHFL